jgi:hypothetical protein
MGSLAQLQHWYRLRGVQLPWGQERGQDQGGHFLH